MATVLAAIGLVENVKTVNARKHIFYDHPVRIDKCVPAVLLHGQVCTATLEWAQKELIFTYVTFVSQGLFTIQEIRKKTRPPG